MTPEGLSPRAERVGSEELLAPGTRVSHYEIVEEIGRGGMGIVYSARDVKLDREVALKCVRPDRASDPDFKKRTLREAHLASRLSHPNIVRVLDVFELDGLPVIVMERIQGSSLREVLERKGPLPVDEVLSVAEDLARALIGAHEHGVLHRDLNPNNVLVTRDGRSLLTDFGLARRAARTDGQEQSSAFSSVSAPDVVVGTPGYMSPEQLLGRELDGRTDIFSLGAVLYECCAGARAFRGTSGAALIDAILNRDPAPLVKAGGAVPEALERVIAKALSKRPEDRYQTAAELAADVRSLRSYERPALATIVTRRRRRGLRAAIVAAAFLLAVAGGVFVLRRVPAPDPERRAASDPVPRQLTTGTGLQANPAISPDGGFVAYASDETGDMEIWLVDVANGQTLRLTTDPADDREPAWFPDGSGLVFVSDRSGERAIWKTARLGGAPVRLVENAREPAISPDGRAIAFARAAAPGGSTQVFVAPLSDVSKAKRVSRVAGFWDHQRPVFSPDGKTICYFDYDGLWLVPVAGGPGRRVEVDEPFPRFPAFSADGSLLYFSCRQNDARSLWSVSVAGGKARRLTLGTGSESEPSVSRDGQRLAYATSTREKRLVLLDLSSGEQTVRPGLRDPIFPVFAADGRAVFVLAAPTGRQDVFSIPLEGRRPSGEPRRVTDVGDPGTFSGSPDGRFLAYHRNVNGQRDIWVGPVVGGTPVRLVDHPAADINPAWSPSGSSLVFASDRDGEFDLWLLPMAGEKAAGAPRKLTVGQGRAMFPVFSPRGDLVAYSGGTGRFSEAWVVPVDGSAPPRAVTSGARTNRVWFGRAPGTLLVSGTWGTPRREVRRVSIEDGTSSPLSPPLVLSGEDVPGDFGVSPDGTLLVYVEHRVRGGIWVLERPDGGF